ncbi:MAG: leucyl aminopeptidase [Ilumatobacteraceae bacterium]|jgi:leucyl aminopeptidase
MQINVDIGDVLEATTGLGVYLAFEGALPDSVAGLLEDGDFAAKPNQTVVVYPKGAVTPRRLLLVGLGAADAITAERLRQAAATAVRAARGLKVAEVSIGVPADLGLDATVAGQAAAEGLLLGAYRFLKHRTGLSDDETFEVATVTLLASAPTDDLSAGVATGVAIGRGVVLARDLVNRPGEFKTPPLLADEAVALGQRTPGVTVTVFDEHRLAAEGFGGTLAVGKGSDSPPRFIIFEYGEHLTDVPTIAVVGKGLTFDSGGLNIKTAEGMETMKNDMGGSAAVFGIVQAVAELGLPVHVVGLVPSAENMPSGRSYRPGDIITSLNGKTIEILNTDAEGRVILSDALHYAGRYEPDAIIELSTLTGAVIIALGSVATAVMATEQTLADQLVQAGDTTGDRAWQLPLWEEYHEMVKSDVADLKNLAGRAAGSITAGAFLAAFAGDYRFAHLDIAGTAWLDSPSKPYHSKGGSGAGVRLVTEYIRSLVS